MKGITKFDQQCHEVFAGNGNGTDYLSRKTGVRCGHCGWELEGYYCEEQLYLVECPRCKIKALAMARSPKQAAYKTFGHAVYPVDEMGEEEEETIMNERSCKNCAYCNMRQFNRGRWYCSSPEVSVFALPVHESLQCFKPRTVTEKAEHKMRGCLPEGVQKDEN